VESGCAHVMRLCRAVHCMASPTLLIEAAARCKTLESAGRAVERLGASKHPRNAGHDEESKEEEAISRRAKGMFRVDTYEILNTQSGRAYSRCCKL
jgi:phage terminase small subunit